ncbi:hypothetical protein ACN47E_010069 [Coniothyrium glycines]
MFIIQTTTAILIAFMALIAWSEIRNRLAKARTGKKDLETPASSQLPQSCEAKRPIPEHDITPLSTCLRDEVVVETELEACKRLYYKLHNIEHHAEILPQCRAILLGLFSSTLSEAFKNPADGILAVEKFSHSALDDFLKAKDVDCTDRWEQYLARRKAGGSREMFGDRAEAEWWLKQAAPVKYVDGAWLGHINKVTTPFKYRQITKNAWQVMSEELGDGDLAKNHVYVYRNLMNDINAGLPAADSEDFIHPRHGLNEVHCWKAALAQLIISLFPHEFLPEVLGFNMAYESLPLHLLKTVKELRELRLNPYYFELHISIDNADSGHAAMAAAAVADYIKLVQRDNGYDAAHVAWKRVQTGYVLAEGLPTTPESPSLRQESMNSFPRDDTEEALVAIFTAKSSVAHKIHCNSRLKIGRQSLVDWLEPNAFKDPRWQQEFLQELSNCKPWVTKGDSMNSRLVKELSWEGKMFGSFTEKEVEVVKSWINSLGPRPDIPTPDSKVYVNFTRRFLPPILEDDTSDVDITRRYPVLACGYTAIEMLLPEPTSDRALSLRTSKLNLRNLLPLWFTSTTLLEALPNVPVRTANEFGSALVRVLRAQTGFDVEGTGVAGMDEVHRTDDGHSIGIIELGFVMCCRARLLAPSDLGEAVAMGSETSAQLSEWMLHMSMRWLTYRDLLIGMSWAFVDLHEQISEHIGDGALLDAEHRCILKEIADRERRGLEFCKVELECNPRRARKFREGARIARKAIGSCFES